MVTGSCSLVCCGRTRMLVDCGLVQGEEDAPELNRASFPFRSAELDAVVLTHGHLDHTGRAPLLVAAGYRGPIFTHAASAGLAEIVWQDTARLSSKDGGQALFDEAQVERTARQLKPLGYDQDEKLGDLGFKLLDAGHILGSAHVLIEGGGKRLLLSGDVGATGTPIVRDPTTRWEAPFDAVLIESTYGDRCHRSRAETLKEFGDLILDACDRKGMVIIPAFAIGRTQELLFHFGRLVESGRLPRLPVLLDSPMAERVTGIYRAHRECYDQDTWALIESGELPMNFPGLRELVTAEQSKRVRTMSPPAIVIAGSGMCTGGRVLHHLKDFLDRESTTVIFVGYQGKGTLGRQLVDGAKRVRILGQEVAVKARIATLNGFSAHADQAGLLDWAKRIPGPPRQWLINHGEENAARGLQAVLERAGMSGAQVVEPGSVFEV